MYKLILSNKVYNELKKIDVKNYLKISDKILELENDPRPVGCIKLRGKDSYRIRVGDYRILYEVDDSLRKISIYHVLHRKDAYR